MEKEQSTTEELFERVKMLHAEFCRLYSDVVVGVSDSHIHLNEEFFKRLMVGKPISSEWNGNQLEAKGEIDGLILLALF